MVNRVAVSLALPDTEECLTTLLELKSSIGLAEVRLDLMKSFDLSRLINESPRQLVITCRPPREGGKFDGSESERLRILAHAMDLGAAYVDVEWDSVRQLRKRRATATKLIASRHWLDHMPTTLAPEFESLRPHADVVKLVGWARRLGDTLPVFDILKRATIPVICLAMGEAGRMTRLLAPCFEHCLLTYGAVNEAEATAPGQFTVKEMIEVYHLDVAGPHTSIHLRLCAGPESARSVIEKNSSMASGHTISIPLIVSSDEAADLVPGLLALAPRLTLTADTQFEGLLRGLLRDHSHGLSSSHKG
jgi:3-dehydroquinate dehydratase / shikimate dehydrogenase